MFEPILAILLVFVGLILAKYIVEALRRKEVLPERQSLTVKQKRLPKIISPNGRSGRMQMSEERPRPIVIGYNNGRDGNVVTGTAQYRAMLMRLEEAYRSGRIAEQDYESIKREISMLMRLEEAYRSGRIAKEAYVRIKKGKLSRLGLLMKN